jgi:hypothetical protein
MLRKRGKGWRALPIAALFTVVLLFVSRRATLRQLNAGLLEVGEQLKLLRQGHGKLSAGDDSSA